MPWRQAAPAGWGQSSSNARSGDISDATVLVQNSTRIASACPAPLQGGHARNPAERLAHMRLVTHATFAGDLAEGLVGLLDKLHGGTNASGKNIGIGRLAKRDFETARKVAGAQVNQRAEIYNPQVHPQILIDMADDLLDLPVREAPGVASIRRDVMRCVIGGADDREFRSRHLLMTIRQKGSWRRGRCRECHGMTSLCG